MYEVLLTLTLILADGTSTWYPLGGAGEGATQMTVTDEGPLCLAFKLVTDPYAAMNITVHNKLVIVEQ